MKPRLFHISEEKSIATFIPRVSKKQWKYKPYVWAIAEEKLHNYLFPRACPRICIDLEKLPASVDGLDEKLCVNKKAIICVPRDWKERIERCTLYSYEFDPSNFQLIDRIAGYYVSEKVERPIQQTIIHNCLEELRKLDIGLELMDKEDMIAIKEKVVAQLTEFSIIKWSNLAT